MNIRRAPTLRGVRSVLTYWYQGRRYRPVLGVNLTTDQERDKALELINAIHAHHAQLHNTDSRTPESPTFAEFVPTYTQYLRTKRVADLGRNETALRLHLMPHFGPRRLRELRLKDGTDGERYRVTVRCAFDNGDELEAEGELQVRNIR